MLYDLKKDLATGKTTVVDRFSGRRVPPDEEAWVLLNTQTRPDSKERDSKQPAQS